MIKVRKKTEVAVQTPTAPKMIPSPITGTVPPVEHRWVKGQSGNPAGKGKLIKDAYLKKMSEPAEVTINVLEGEKIVEKTIIATRADAIAERLTKEATSSYRMGTASAQLGAIQEMRKVIEPTESEEAQITASALHTALMQGFLRVAQVKLADAIEV